MKLLAGEAIEIVPDQFTHSLAPTTNLNDELTLLAHLGYLAYDCHTHKVRIPNDEIRAEFLRDITENQHAETMRLITESDQLLRAVWRGDCEHVARCIEIIHKIIVDPKHYNQERDLVSVVRAAFYTSIDHYILIYELPGGNGYCDMVFLPKKGTDVPLMIIELNWNRAVKSAIEQIKQRDYPAVLKEYGGKILLVGITYQVKSKKHTCTIEEMEL